MAKNILISYYSWAGSTKKVAKMIHDVVGGTLFEIDPALSYSDNYNEVVKQAKKEIQENYKPDLKSDIEDISSYDIIFIGTPNWWSTAAPPVATFLSNHDFSGKTIVPFVTHGGGGLSRCAKDIAALCPNSSGVLNAFSSYESTADEAKITSWLNELGFAK